MSVPELLHGLLEARGPSGHETAAAAVWRDGCAAFADEVTADINGSSRATVKGTGEGPRLAIVGHIDEIGLHVTHIDDDGFLRFGGIGGWDPLVLVGQRIAIATREGVVTGVVARKPIHLLRDEDRNKAPEIKDLHIDIGAKDGEEARGVVRIGDSATIDVGPVELRNDRVVARALDNRVGCYVAARAAQLVAEGDPTAGDVIALAVVQEETSFGGSRTSAFALDPDVAIAVDVTFETKQPGVELGEMTKHEFGTGPVISRGTTLHPKVFEGLYAAGEAESIPFTVESHGRTTGTDADAFFKARAGIPTGLVSVPNRYMHSPVEMCALEDIENAARLIAAYARTLEPGMSFAR